MTLPAAIQETGRRLDAAIAAQSTDIEYFRDVLAYLSALVDVDAILDGRKK